MEEVLKSKKIPSTMTKYVLGFAIDKVTKRVLLIKKLRPTWQLGHLNGIGGRIEKNEYHAEAMVREFKEECGIQTKWEDWQRYAVMEGPDWICHVFKTFKVNIHEAATMTDESIAIVNIATLNDIVCISNIPWLIHMALDANTNGTPFEATIKYA